jgi:hypothetical protein
MKPGDGFFGKDVTAVHGVYRTLWARGKTTYEYPFVRRGHRELFIELRKVHFGVDDTAFNLRSIRGNLILAIPIDRIAEFMVRDSVEGFVDVLHTAGEF